MPAALFKNDVNEKAKAFEDSRRFLEAIFTADDLIEIRTAKDKGLGQFCRLADYPTLFPKLCRLNDADRHVWFGVNPRTHEASDASAVAIARAAAIDLDGVDPEELIARCDKHLGFRPTITISSGGGSQGFFVFDREVTAREWISIQAGITEAVPGADPTICDVPQVLRLVGFRNTKDKYAPDFPRAAIVDIDPTRRFSPDAFPTPTRPIVEQDAGESSIVVPAGYLPKKAVAFLERGELYPAPGGAAPSRRGTAFAVACAAAAAGIPQEDIEPKILERLIELGLDGSDLEDMPRQIASAYSKPRSPDIDEEDLPRGKIGPGRAVVDRLVDAGGGKIAITVRVGDKRTTETLDPAKGSARRAFLDRLKKAFPKSDLAPIEERLESVAAGEETPASPTGPDSTEEEVESSHVIRPERYVIVGDAEVVSAFSVHTRKKTAKGLSGRWMTITKRGDFRGAAELVDAVEVEGVSFHVDPCPEAPDSFPVGWSLKGRRAWLSGAGPRPGADLFDELVQVVDQFIDFPPAEHDAACRLVSLFTILTYNSCCFAACPYLAFNGPAGSGKTRGLEILAQLAHRPLLASASSAAAMFRSLHSHGSTVLLDEAEQLHGAEVGPLAELRSLMLAGYKRQAFILRCSGDDHEVTAFYCGGPKAMASIKEPDPTLASRCIQFFMLRAAADSPKAARHPDAPRFSKMWSRLRDDLFAWSIDNGPGILATASEEALGPLGLMPRSREIWHPLFALAQVLEQQGSAGLAEVVARYALAKEDRATARTPDIDVAVLRALYRLTARRADDPSRFRIPACGDIGHEAATELGGNPIHSKQVKAVLRGYGLQDRILKGRYVFDVRLSALEDVARRYGIVLDDSETLAPIPPLISSPSSPSPPSTPVSSVKTPEKSGPRGGQGDEGDEIRGVVAEKNDPPTGDSAEPAKPRGSRKKKTENATEPTVRPGRVQL